MSAFTHRSLKGCSTQVQTHYFKGIVRPVLDYTSPLWDPHRQHLASTLEMVQRRSARRILQDFCTTSSASEMVAKLHLEPLSKRRTADKACMMYKVMHGLMDLSTPPGLLQPAPQRPQAEATGAAHKD